MTVGKSMFKTNINMKKSETIEKIEKISFFLFLWEANFFSAKRQKLQLLLSIPIPYFQRNPKSP